jgi:hypothetical protein
MNFALKVKIIIYYYIMFKIPWDRQMDFFCRRYHLTTSMTNDSVFCRSFSSSFFCRNPIKLTQLWRHSMTNVICLSAVVYHVTRDALVTTWTLFQNLRNFFSLTWLRCTPYRSPCGQWSLIFYPCPFPPEERTIFVTLNQFLKAALHIQHVASNIDLGCLVYFLWNLFLFFFKCTSLEQYCPHHCMSKNLWKQGFQT